MLKKSGTVGISVSPEKGLELAQIDTATGTVLKYGHKPIDYNIVRREITDLDLFKDALQDLLEEQAIPKGTEIVLNFPTIVYKVSEYPAALEEIQVESAIEEDLYEEPYLQNYEPCYGFLKTSSSLQFNRYAYTALQKAGVIEIILSLKELGYKVKAIETSVDSVLQALQYLDMVNTDVDTNWVLLTVENSCCRVLSMSGKKIVDIIEEKISIGEVLSDAENYATIISSVEPILKNLPSKYLCVVSKTNVISAEILSNKLTYSSPIIYQEANSYLKEPLLQISSLIDSEFEKRISLDVIGAAIYSDFSSAGNSVVNLYNKSLGEIYMQDQPITIMDGKIKLTNQLLISAFIAISAVVILVLIIVYSWLSMQENNIKNDIETMNTEIGNIQRFLEQNKDISTSTFDEGDEIKIGLAHNKSIYSYYTIVGTEIPQKLWLTHLKLGDKITIDGQADNLESVYAFFRNIKDYDSNSDIRIQKLEMTSLANKSDDINSDILITSSNADFYSFRISNDIEETPAADKKDEKDKESKSNTDKPNLPELEPIQ